jgi:hypothetical protein
MADLITTDETGRVRHDPQQILRIMEEILAELDA